MAVVGYSYRLPQVNPNNFWDKLVARQDLITKVASSRWSVDNLLHVDKNHPGTSYTYNAGSLGDVSNFDAQFFGVSPREAAAMDPQQRHLLEMSWEAIEHAGIKPSSLRESDCGVFLGIASLDYSYRIANDLGLINSSTATGNTSSIASNRISYTFDLHGPSFSMDTACSSSLVAFHQACQSILSGEVSTAIAGGISLHLHPFGFIIFAKAKMLSPTGRCHVFDESADGYVRSEGGGVFLLKDYDQAVADKDIIHAVVAASMVNTDGYKSGLTIPSQCRQVELLEKVYAKAQVKPENIDYIEAHGTGTSIGDPIETYALGKALGSKRSEPLPIGSVKSNLGHLETASGVAGIAKALLVLKHREIPATIGIKKINPEIKTDLWNLKIVDENLALKPQGKITVGINSFGFGGSNAHLILESHEEEQINSSSVNAETQILPVVVSAKSNESLKNNVQNLMTFLNSDGHESFYDIAWNYYKCKERLEESVVIFAKNKKEASKKLELFDIESPDQPNTVFRGKGLVTSKGPVFVYSGNGCQWETMGKSMLLTSIVFRQTIEKIDKLFNEYSNFSLVEELQGLNGNNRFEYTEIAQPTLFAIQVGITECLKDNGVIPSAVIGHSVGEVAAAWASNALSLPDAVRVIYYRSFWQGKTKGHGAMSAVRMSESEMIPFLALADYKEVHLAGVNSYRGVTLAGNRQQLELLGQELDRRSVFNIILPLDYAFHSPAMCSIEAPLIADLVKIEPRKTKIDFISTVYGEVLSGELLNEDYWWKNIREPVLFEKALNVTLKEGFNCFVEIGAHPVLRSYQQDQLHRHNIEGVHIATFNRGVGNSLEIDKASAAILLAGADQEKQWFEQPGKRIETPSYAWQLDSHWYKNTAEYNEIFDAYYLHPLLGSSIPLQKLQWQSSVDSKKQSWLADHKIGESVVFPGAAFIELALNAASHFKDEKYIEVEGLEILNALILEDGISKNIQTKVDEFTGEISIYSRTQTTSEEWVQNCKARACHQPTVINLQIENNKLPTRRADFDATQHHALALRAGLEYGPAFSAIKEGWFNSKEVFAILDLPKCIDEGIDAYKLHPGVLDSAIQLVIHFLADQIESNSGTAFIPTRVERVTIKRDVPLQPSQAKLTLEKRSSHSLLVNIYLYDDSGAIIAYFDAVRFKAIKLYQSDRQQISYLDYQLIPAPINSNHYKKLSTNILTCFNNVLVENERLIERYEAEVVPLIDHMIELCVYEVLQDLSAKEIKLNIADLEILNIRNPEQENLRSQLLAFALEHSLLMLNEDEYQICEYELEEGVTSALIWNSLIRDYPDHFNVINLAGSTMLKLKTAFDIAKTDKNLPEYLLLFNSINKATYQGIIGKTLRQVISAESDGIAKGQRFRVMEVGSTRPYFARSICNELNFDNCDYSFASSESDTLENLEHLKEEFHLIESLVLNRSTQELLTPAEQFNLAVITLDSYNIDTNIQTITKIKPFLADGAIVLFIGLQDQSWLNFSFTDVEDWWRDGKSVQTNSAQWINTLEDHCYQNIVDIIDRPTSAMTIVQGQWSTIKNVGTENVTKSKNENWLILGGDSTKDQCIIAGLSAATHKKIFLTGETTKDQLVAYINQQGEAGIKFDQIIVVHQIGDNKDPLTSQTKRCSILTELYLALEVTQLHVVINCITEGVGQCLGKTLSNAEKITPADAAFWGFTRTLMNESVNNIIKLIDLPTGLSKSSIDSLITELELLPSASEVVLGSNGERFISRIQFKNDPKIVHNQKNNNQDKIKLDFSQPGQLKNLEWQQLHHSSLLPNEVDIEVKATGLNFRDVMYALGLLSDEAIENGFAGASLGLEFSGIIKSVGSEVTKFKPGDDVIGFGSSCFSNRLIATEYSIALLPQSISYQGGATIPTAFLTVYYALHHLARLQPGERVLIHGAAGGVGIAAIQIAQWMGAEIYATVGSEKKREFLQLMGVKNIYNSRDLGFAEEILRDTANSGAAGIDIVLNSLSGEAIKQNFRVLKPFGRFLELGKRDFYEDSKIGLRPFRNNISYFGIDADQLQKEQPVLTAKLFSELMQLFADGTLSPLPYSQFSSHEVIDAFRYMQQAKQIGKIIVNYDEAPTVDIDKRINKVSASLVLDPKGSYIVTGGLAGFGLKTAQWLVEKGAKSLLLLSRRGASSVEAKVFIEKCRTQQAEVRAVACDVTDKSALKSAIILCDKELGPIKGIIHAATVIEDTMVSNLTASQIERSMAAKLKGAQGLDEISRELGLTLDMFILYSSVTTLWGNPGQAAYVAANHWLEALTAIRRSNGLPATCIRWGAIEDAGFLARNTDIKETLKNRLGSATLNSDDAMNIMEQMLLNNSQTLAVMELNWNTLSRFLLNAEQEKFKELALQSFENENNEENQLDVNAMMAELSEKDFKLAILDVITYELGEILMLPASKINPEKSIYELGMDSLMGVELMAAVEAKIGIRIPVMALTETPKLSQLTDKIISLIHKEDEVNDFELENQLRTQHGANEFLQQTEPTLNKNDLINE